MKVVDEYEHGTSLAYQHRKCRCARCREWNASKARELRQRRGLTPAELLSTRAQYKALRQLAKRHPDEYDQLFRAARQSIALDMGLVPQPA